MLRNAVPDKTLLQKVSQRLMRLGSSSHHRCTAVVTGGDVTLTGTLQFEMQRKPLVRAATSVAGVRRCHRPIAVGTSEETAVDKLLAAARREACRTAVTDFLSRGESDAHRGFRRQQFLNILPLPHGQRREGEVRSARLRRAARSLWRA